MNRNDGAARALARLAAIFLVAGLALTAARAEEFVGIVYPGKDVMLSVQVAGVVKRVPVRVGQRVRAGQTLIEVESQTQQLELDRRELILQDVAEQTSIQQRTVILEQLVKDASLLYEAAGTVSREELMKLKLELEESQGRLAQLREAKRREGAEVKLADQERRMRILAAPTAGVVTSIRPDPGEWVAPGDPVVRLVDDSWCELRVNVSLAAARTLAVNTPVSVLLEDAAVPTAVAGRVSFISPVVDAASALVEIRIRLPNDKRLIRPGVKARLRTAGLL